MTQPSGNYTGIDEGITLQAGSLTSGLLYVGAVGPVTNIRFSVWRISGDSFLNVGYSEVFPTTTTIGLNTFDLASPITGVQDGDLLGISWGTVPSGTLLYKADDAAPGMYWYPGDNTTTLSISGCPSPQPLSATAMGCIITT